MSPREIIAEAWAIVREQRALRHWSYTSSFFSLLLTLKLVAYQVYFGYELLAGHGGGGFFDVEIAIYNSTPPWFFWSFIVFFGLLVIVEIFYPHLARGAIIGLSAKAYNKQPVEGGLVLGLYNFFALFTIHEFIVLGSLSNLVTIISMVVRYVNGDIRVPIIMILTGLWIFSLILKFIFVFAEEAVVVNRVSVFEALGISLKLLLSYMSRIMFLYILLLVISLRILINAALIIVIPGIVIGLAILLTTFLSVALSYTIASIVGLALIAVASYFFGYIDAFKHAVWTITYIELKKHPDLDAIS
jgi:hypothetical protein